MSYNDNEGTETINHRLSQIKHEQPAVSSQPSWSMPVIRTGTTLSVPTSTGTGFEDHMAFLDNAANPVCRALAVIASMAAMAMARHMCFGLLTCVVVPALLPLRVPHVLIVLAAVSLAFGKTPYAGWIAGTACQLLIAGSTNVS